ncbi:hypothetical protein D3C80_1962780 [compost metagenome]
MQQCGVYRPRCEQYLADKRRLAASIGLEISTLGPSQLAFQVDVCTRLTRMQA